MINYRSLGGRGGKLYIAIETKYDLNAAIILLWCLVHVLTCDSPLIIMLRALIDFSITQYN
jgi:hypothetical protein